MRATVLSTAAAVAVALSGCYTPQGGLMPYTGAAATYPSTESRPATVTIVDTRTGEPFFTMEIPPGKQLVLDFKEGQGDDPVLTPDLMRYQVFDLGTSIGTLRNAMTVPGAASRRIDVDYRRGPEYAPAPAGQARRTDTLADRPDWWSPRGGPIPDANTNITIYDD